MNEQDIKTATLDLLVKKQKTNKKILALFAGMMIVLIIANIITFVISKKFSASALSFFCFLFLFFSLKSSADKISAEIKLRQQNS